MEGRSSSIEEEEEWTDVDGWMNEDKEGVPSETKMENIKLLGEKGNWQREKYWFLNCGVKKQQTATT